MVVADIALNKQDVRVMIDCLEGRTPSTPSDIDRAARLARCMRRVHVEEVSDEQETQHEAPQPRQEPVRPQGEAARHEQPVRPDPVGRPPVLSQALRGLIPGL